MKPIRPNIGWFLTSNGIRVPKRFTLGYDKREASKRRKLLEALWSDVCNHNPNDPEPEWDKESLAFANLLKKGQREIPFPRKAGERDEIYAQRFHHLQKDYPSLTFAVESGYDEGNKLLEVRLNRQVQQLPYAKSAVVNGRHKGTFHQALEDYRAWIPVEYHSPHEGITDYGQNKLGCAKQYLDRLDDIALPLLDVNEIESMIQYFRNRPPKRNSRGEYLDTPMAVDSCSNYISELMAFLKWLHKNQKYDWQLPYDVHLIKRRVKITDEEIDAGAEETPVYRIKELELLNKYATPIERVFLLLGLNCGYGADQSGRLRINQVKWEKKAPFIRRVRHKRQVKAYHRLWTQTLDGLKWALKKRPADSKDVLIIKKDGSSYWRKTKGGNRAKDIPKLFGDLVGRVQKDYPDFPWYGFNAIRDTSVNMVRQMAGEEMAQIHAAHKHQSIDKNLNAYSNPNITKLFRVHRRLEQKLASVFEAAGEFPFEPTAKNYLGWKKKDKINQMLSLEIAPKLIAKECEVSVATVYRYRQSRSNL